MLEDLKKQVLEANLQLVKHGLVVFTWGNVSGFDEESGYMAIKPSGVEYDRLHAEDIVIVDVNTEKVVEGALKPSSDMPTHAVIYRNFKGVKGIAHTHSKWATSFAQAGEDIPALGTTHADYFYGDVPCTRKMKKEEIEGAYEEETGNVIVSCFKERKIRPSDIPAVLVHSHGPFVWGKDAAEAVYHSVVLEEVAAMALRTRMINPDIKKMQRSLLDKHFLRKHGENAYYGQ